MCMSPSRNWELSLQVTSVRVTLGIFFLDPQQCDSPLTNQGGVGVDGLDSKSLENWDLQGLADPVSN